MAKIRLATQEDAPYLCDIYNYEIEHGVATFDEKLWNLTETKNWITSHNKDHPLFVILLDGKVVGYCGLSEFRHKDAFKTTAELSLYISKDYQGKGLGQKLFSFVLRYAKEQTTLHAIVSVVTSGNEVSAHLHLKAGFVYQGTLREVGMKNNRFLDCDFFQLTLNETSD